MSKFTSKYSSLRRLVTGGLVVSSLFGLSSAHALTMCINSTALFESAMNLGQFQSEALQLKIVQGTYNFTGGVVVDLSSRTTIEGGYTANCASRNVDPANTVINIGQGHRWYVTQDESSPESLIAIDGLTFTNTNKGITFTAGQPNHIGWDDDGSLRITRSRFTQISSDNDQYQSVAFLAQNNQIEIENVLFDHVSANPHPEGCAVKVHGPSGGSVLINHVSADLSTGGNFCLGWGYGEDPTDFHVYNSILRSYALGGGHVAGTPNEDSVIHLFNNIMFGSQVNGATIVESNQLSQNPGWVDGPNGNYHLATAPLSAAINSGNFVPPGGEPATDIEGNPRIQGSFPDRGAFESSYNDQTLLTVTSTADSGGGSLRQAILDANSSPLIAKQIKFDIRGANQIATCPAVIALNSTLPPIAAPIALDAYTQPISSRNTDTNIFNGVTCVVIKPAAGTLPVGFQVPAAAGANVAFSLRGVAMGGFAQPVLIQGGSNHVIGGNQFGGSALGVNLPGATLNAISIGVNVGGSIIVGGTAVADRNVIVDADLSGVNIQSQVQSTPDHCQIVNNLIGLKADGKTASANNVGVNVTGSGCGLFGNRIAGNALDNVWLQSGSAGNVLQKNFIGVAADGEGTANSATGVLISGANNLIGAPGMNGVGAGNTIRFNTAGGVVVAGSAAASGNTINGNVVYDNGASGLDIDLQPTGSAAGPTANDPGDVDAGANGVQNFPVAKQLVYTAAGSANRPATVGGVLDSVPGSYRIDAYYSDKVSPIGKRGHAQTAIGRMTLVVPANGRGVFSLPVVVPSQAIGGAISFTATDSAGNTSEVGSALLTDSIFVDSID